MATRYYSLPEAPKTPLGRYRALAPSCGLRVSPIQLGGTNIGDKWHGIGFGYMDKESSFKLLDAYFEAGGNFIDTANHYQDGTSEQFIGEWAECRGIRDQLVIATKYTSILNLHDESVKIKINYTGNNAKSLRISVEQSLKNLRTDYIDILYAHWWDFITPIEEVMDTLNDLVSARKVLYLGISGAPAWVVAQANTYARLTGKRPFVIYQGEWSILQRSFEREIIPMAREYGMALAPFKVLCSGMLRSDEEERRREESGEKGRATMQNQDWRRNERQKAMCVALEKVAREVGGAVPLQAVAIAYVMHKTAHVFPVIGCRKIEQLMVNIEALKISLSEEQIAYLESIVPFDSGWPATMIGDGTYVPLLMAAAGHEDRWPLNQPIKPNRT